MIARIKALVDSNLALFLPDGRKRIPIEVLLVMVALAILAPVVFASSLRAASTAALTHDQARTYAGILAQVIPVLLLALYIESAAHPMERAPGQASGGKDEPQQAVAGRPVRPRADPAVS